MTDDSLETYFSCNKVTQDKEDSLANRTIGIEDLLAALEELGVPLHELQLKVGAVCSIMRNLAVDKELVKNARVIVVALYTHCVAINIVGPYPKQLIIFRALHSSFILEVALTMLTAVKSLCALPIPPRIIVVKD